MIARLGYTAFAVARDIMHDLAAAGRMADMNGIFQVEMRDHRREIVGVMVHVVAIRNLAGAAMPAPVMSNHAIALAQEEQHLGVPVIRGQWPAMTEYDRLPLAPILVEDFDAVLCGDRRHCDVSLALNRSGTRVT